MSKNDDLVRRLRKRADHFGNILTDPPRPHPDAELLREAIDAIERGAAQGIRPLEWEERGGAFYADTALGECCIEDSDDGIHVIENGRKHIDFASVEAAKSFVQSNHDRYVNDWLSTPPAPAQNVREGWKLVPVKPTNEMIGAAVRATEPLEYDDDICRAEFRRTYHAMISAAPAPQPPAVEAEAVERRSMVETFGGTAMMPREDGEWVRFTDHEATIKKEIERLREELHRANGVADLAIKHRESAEASNKALREELRGIRRALLLAGWEEGSLMIDGIDRALLSEKGA